VLRTLFMCVCAHACTHTHTHTPFLKPHNRNACESIDMQIFTVVVRLIMVLMFVESPVESILKSKLRDFFM